MADFRRCTRRCCDWYADHARDLPWREPGATPWAVLVSEFMLQQTPVARVLPAYEAWLARWPTPGRPGGGRARARRCGHGAGSATRAARCGCTRRPRHHRAARRRGARLVDELLALPGVGDYTAAAVASFAFGQRHAVLDTNVRRVLARLVSGPGAAAPAAPRRRSGTLAESLLPDDGPRRPHAGRSR